MNDLFVTLASPVEKVILALKITPTKLSPGCVKLLVEYSEIWAPNKQRLPYQFEETSLACKTRHYRNLGIVKIFTEYIFHVLFIQPLGGCKDPIKETHFLFLTSVHCHFVSVCWHFYLFLTHKLIISFQKLTEFGHGLHENEPEE